jgi:predicted ferric reductase
LKFGRSPFNVIEHPFSISSAPIEPLCVRFTIKETGDFTNQISTIAVGTRAYLDGPHGRFTLAGHDARKIVFIAGGVGFAPIISMLRQLVAERHPHSIRLIYGNRKETQILYAEEIETLKNALDLDVHLVLSEPPAGWPGLVGELSLEVVRVCLVTADPDALYFVCGPTAMMNSVERSLTELGIQSRQVVSERFKYE